VYLRSRRDKLTLRNEFPFRLDYIRSAMVDVPSKCERELPLNP
jgi:hypothetical protein